MTTHSKSKTTVFYFVLIVVFWILMEIITYTFLGIRDGRLFSWSEHSENRTELIAEYKAELDEEQLRNEKSLAKPNKLCIRNSEEVIHPYIGYVMDHNDSRCPDFGYCDDRNRNRNRNKSSEELRKKKANQIIVGIFGGSFASGVSNSSTI